MKLERILRLFGKKNFFCVFFRKFLVPYLWAGAVARVPCVIFLFYTLALTKLEGLRPRDPPFPEIIGPKHVGIDHFENFRKNGNVPKPFIEIFKNFSK